MLSLYKKVAFSLGEMITKTYSTSFSIAVGALPQTKRQAIYAVYGFVRVADEIVDTFSFCNQERLLNELENDLETALQENCSSNPVLYSFVTTIKEYNIPLEHVYSFLASMRADLHKSTYHHEQETEEYIYGSAEVVGLMCLMIFLDGDTQQFDELQASARRLGAAFQKVNFLRDIQHDYNELGRSYFPDVEFEHFSEQEKTRIEQEIESDFEEAYKGIVRLPHDSKIAVYIAYRYFLELFDKLKKTPASRIMETRIRVSNSVKGSLFFRSFVRWRLKMIG